MIARRKSSRPSRHRPAPVWHAAFLAMLPAIARHAKIAFRHLDPAAREDAVQEAIANATVAYARLVQLHKADVAYPLPLARYAVAQIRDGRRVGNRLNIQDVLSPYARRRKGFQVERLDHFDEEENQWQEAIVEDHTAAPADLAASRIDFSAWLKSHPARKRKIAEALAMGHTTTEVSQRFGVSQGRVSQLRQEFQESWNQFHGGTNGNQPDAA